MLRRSFLGAIATIPFVKFGQKRIIRQEDLYLFNGELVKDPFVKIYTSKTKTMEYNSYKFTEGGDCVYCHGKFNKITVPLSSVSLQKTKSGFLKELGKPQNKAYKDCDLFEIIASNGKSNLLAVTDTKNG